MKRSTPTLLIRRESIYYQIELSPFRGRWRGSLIGMSL